MSRQLTPSEIEQISFMRHHIATSSKTGHRTKKPRLDFELDQERKALTIGVDGVLLKQEPVYFLGPGKIIVANWSHLEVFRLFPVAYWATETRQPPNPIMYMHHFLHLDGGVLMSGVGKNPAAHYFYLIEDPEVTAEFEEPAASQEHLRAEYDAAMHEYDRQKRENPEHAKRLVALDVDERNIDPYRPRK